MIDNTTVERITTVIKRGVMFWWRLGVLFRYAMSVSPAPPAIMLAIIAGTICARMNKSMSAEIPKINARMKYFKKLLPFIIICPKNKAPEFLSCLLIRFSFQMVKAEGGYFFISLKKMN